MKTIKIICITFLLLIHSKSYSAIHVISQSGSSFSPSSLTVNVGDVVRWEWSGGTHTTTSQSVPDGAATWDSPLTASVTSFEYTVTVAGTYNYVCTIHESMGMTGSFTAGVSSSIDKFDLQEVISLYPNPAVSFINIKTSVDGEIRLSDILGKSIRTYHLNELPSFDDSFRLELDDLTQGVYIISFLPANTKKRISLKFIKD